ncbi:hypothetical protein PsYK624_045250 [Phanerochaete sordida]|uniref:Uncharacterized protein n=1 Tax=Phanerochaete sordida TaxID=48140 RepID=A0A9P3G5G2_9APHY|nr:hypothetical protein PsYK624_045250 [Phanerochaete sordida]
MSYSPSWVTYAEQLVGRGFGLPLWQPEAEPGPYGDVQIGDVGFVSEGQFIRLFNAMYPADHPINVYGVPQNFVVLQPDRRHFRTRPRYVAPGPICTSTTRFQKVGAEVADQANIVGASYSFSCHGSKGAVTVLGGFGHQEWYISNRAFWEYIAAHHSSWCTYAKEKGFLVRSDAIVLVSGWLKTTNWALAAISNSSTAHEFSISASAGSYASASFEVTAGSAVQMSWVTRCGPFNDDVSPGACNQCLFIRYYKIKTRPLKLGRAIGVKAEARDLVDPGDGRPSRAEYSALRRFFDRLLNAQRDISSPSSADQAPQECEDEVTGDLSSGSMDIEISEEPNIYCLSIAEPLNDLLELVLERRPDAKSVVLCHDDLFSLFPPEMYPQGITKDAMQEQLRVQGLETKVDDDGVAYVFITPNPVIEGDAVEGTALSRFLQDAGFH